MSETRKGIFRDLLVGESFHFDRGIESGLTCHMGSPSSATYTKRSARTYTRDSDGQRMQVGSIHATVWRTA